MLIGDNTELRNVNFIDINDIQRIKDYLQGAVYCWCNTKGEEWFSARDFVGKENFDWRGTPCQILFDALYKDENNVDYAVEEAGKALGRILKTVLSQDMQRTFETKKEFKSRIYRWKK